MTGVEIALAASAVLGAATTVAQSAAANKTAKYQAEAMRQNADIVRQRAAAEESKYRRQTEKLLGRQRALVAASGLSLEGSPLLAQEETAAHAELDALTIRHSGDLEAAARLNDAMLTRLKGRNALIGGVASAGQSLLGGYVDYERARARSKTSPEDPSP